ncbi:MAG: hypothetical protein IT429_06255 [Gemmataceae bacterium]|nr:hypothetical protein [Gemmataceae bacterium]
MVKIAKWALLAALLGSAALAAAFGGGGREDARAGTSLVRGWNNVAYLGETKPPAEALASLGTTYSAVYRWDAAAGDFDMYAPGAPSYVNTISELRAGDAIWLELNAESGSLPSLAPSGPSTGGGANSGKVSIAASTFLPASDLAIYEKSFNEIKPVGMDEASRRYYAPVSLPDGAKVTSMTAAFEATGGEVQVRLDYTPLANGTSGAQIYKLVEVLSTAGASPLTAAAFAHTVDNGANVYFLVVDLTGGPGTKLRGVSIAWAY